ELQQINHSRVGMQFDFYHVVKEGLSPRDQVERYFSYVRHVQIAGAPDRHEPNLQLHGLLAGVRQLRSMGYTGFLGLEYRPATVDRKSTRLNSSHVKISYAVFCLKKKKNDLSPYHLLLTPKLYAHSACPHLFFTIMIRPPPSSTLFPYTTLFRSRHVQIAGAPDRHEPNLQLHGLLAGVRQLRSMGYTGFLGLEYRPAT